MLDRALHQVLLLMPLKHRVRNILIIHDHRVLRWHGFFWRIIAGSAIHDAELKVAQVVIAWSYYLSWPTFIDCRVTCGSQHRRCSFGHSVPRARSTSAETVTNHTVVKPGEKRLGPSPSSLSSINAITAISDFWKIHIVRRASRMLHYSPRKYFNISQELSVRRWAVLISKRRRHNQAFNNSLIL